MATADDLAASIIQWGPVGHMDLHKLLYLTQVTSLMWFWEPAFEDPIEAWAGGPVVRQVAGHYMDWGEHHITEPYAGDPGCLSRSHDAALQYVFKHYGRVSSTILWLIICCSDGPWSVARGTRTNTDRCSEEIDMVYAKDWHMTRGLVLPESVERHGLILPDAPEHEPARLRIVGDR